MSSIMKMSVQGIRSFGPDDKDRGVIQFFAPLTLILGPNGTGKTTIIECLKYMTTGEMPPGGKTGGAFIHDPKIANERSVKAQIRLQFQDVRGEICVSQRSLEAVQSTKNVTMKTLEGVITRTKKDGSKASVSQRCADMDREMVALLGVSKSILDNVIFCHQEESNWPLSEGKALKQKFDDIFASTRYVKALDAIRKLRLEHDSDLKNFRAEIKFLKANKEKAAEFRGELQERESRYLAAKERVEKVDGDKKPIEDKLMKIQDRTEGIQKIQNQVAGKQSELQHLRKQATELKGQITHPFTGSTAELNIEISQFEGRLQEKEGKLTRTQRDLQRLETKLEKLDEEKSRLLLERGKLEQEAERNSENLKKRKSVVHEVADKLGIYGYAGDIDEDCVESFLQELSNKEEKALDKAKTSKAKFEKQEKMLQDEIDKKRKEQTSLETTVQMKKQRLQQNQDEVRSVNQELRMIASSSEKLEDLDRRLRIKQTELNEAEAAEDLDKIKEEIGALQRQRIQLDAARKTLENELKQAMQDSSIRNELDLFQKDKTDKEAYLRRLRAKTDDSLKHLLGDVPTENVARALDSYNSKQGRLVRAAQSTLQELRNQHTRLQADRSNVNERIRQREEEMRQCERKMDEICGGNDLDVSLDEVQTALHSEQDRKGTITGMKFLYGKYIDRLRQDNDTPCPLCHRLFENRSEVDELIDELQQKLHVVPEKLEESEQKIDRFRSKYDQIQQLKPTSQKLVELKTTELPQLKEKLATLDEDIKKVNLKLTQKEDELEMLAVDESAAKSLQADATLMDKCNTELRELNRKINSLSARLSGAGTSKSPQEIQREKEELGCELDGVVRKQELKQEHYNEQMERRQRLRTQLTDIRTEKLEVERKKQQEGQLREKLLSLQDETVALEGEIDDAQDELKPIQDDIDQLQSDKQNIVHEKQSTWDKDLTDVDVVKDAARKVQDIHQQIRSYIMDGREQHLQRCRDRSAEMEEKTRAALEEKDTLAETINQTRRDLDEQKAKQRSLQDNLRLRRCEEDVVRVQADLGVLEAELGGLDVTNLEGERRQLQEQLDHMIREKHTAEGRKAGLQEEIKHFKKQLNEEQYRNAEDKHRDKMIAVKTTEFAVEDLEKYYRALDRAIMSYHNTKMSEINKIIRELWRNTYRGNDIDTIEIRSDEEEATTTKRRTYHYRVVMLKGDTAIDMRGRCSAGQKVLASLIIRLALAETFCINCGILALDEPTTNLDRENIESLAYALVEIIKSRSRQRNFQLLVITHDEDFVELLGRSSYVDEFFKVRKNQFGCSQLVKACVQDLHSR